MGLHVSTCIIRARYVCSIVYILEMYSELGRPYPSIRGGGGQWLRTEAAHSTANGSLLMQGMRKVKAHQSEHAGVRVEDKLRGLGNDWAGDRAKNGGGPAPEAR